MTSDPPDNDVVLKTRKPGQTVCDEPGSQDGFCCGHLKVFHLASPEVLRRVRPGERVFRCARCNALYAGERIAHLH
jgi:hypothetical protein